MLKQGQEKGDTGALDGKKSHRDEAEVKRSKKMVGGGDRW